MNLRAALVLLILGLGITTQPSLADPITFTISLIDVPGSASTMAMGINNAGQIMGSYTDNTGSTHGFLDTNGTFVTLDFRAACLPCQRASTMSVSLSGRPA
jgi:probable HAF family extracellular repeat protein